MLQRFRFLLAAFVLGAGLTLAHAAKDKNDNEGTFEHPEITRFPGFHIDDSKRNDFHEFVFATRGFESGSADPVGGGEVKAGRYWWVDYILNDGARQPSSIELVRNYENAVKKAGGALVARHPKSGAPELAVFRMPAGGSERWIQLSINNEGYRYQLAIVEVGAMAQKLEFSADQMADAIRKNGFVALNGILFDTGKATIKPESNALLAEVVALLKKEKALRLAVEGHTDNVGDKRANQELSKQRAESVVRHLAAQGIPAARLKWEGRGDSAPVADNRSEEGRAKNRRVELVKF